MTGYSKLQIIENTETRCSSSDLVVPKADYSESKQMETQESNDHEMKVPNPSRESPAAEVELGGDQEGYGPNYLRRNSSVTSAYALQSAVKRAFSMTRSASSSASCDRYCRIHDQAVTVTSPLEDDDDDDDDDGDGDGDQQVMGGRRRSETKRRSGKLVKAWKKIFGMKY